MNIESKLSQVGTTIFTEMSALANKYNAINLSQGFPNFKSNNELNQLVSEAMFNGFNQYAPMQGAESLRNVISKKYINLHRVSYNPESEITITAGATQAIFTIISAFINKDDEVIIFRPAYDCYEPAITLNKGKTISIELEGADYKINWNVVKSKLSRKTKMIIINSPHNPSGTILSKSDFEILNELTTNSDIIVLSDEVYEHIIFDNNTHFSAGCFDNLKQRSFVVGSFGKTFHNTGWKVGYCCAPKKLMTEFRKVHQFNVFSVNHPAQIGIAEFMKTDENYTSLSNFFQKKRDLFLSLIANSKFSFNPSQGTYFQTLCYKNIDSSKDTDFAKKLTIDYKIASIPLSVFYESKRDDKMLRFCFAKTDETLIQAAEILNSL